MKKNVRFSLWYFVILLLSMMLFEWLFFSDENAKEIPYSQFIDSVKTESIEQIVIGEEHIYGTFKPTEEELSLDHHLSDSAIWNYQASGQPAPWRVGYQKIKANLKRQFYVVKLPDHQLLEKLQESGVVYKGVIENNWFRNFLANWVLPFGLMSIVWAFVLRKMNKHNPLQNGGNNFLNVGGNKAKIYAAEAEHLIHFNDVAGCDEAKQELEEVVDFLQNPKKYTELGASIPKGILLVGPPGTGKTLLAKAVAGEAGVQFYSLSGSDFVEMFVGVGAARVRDLFQEAKSKSPCIIFIDELDAIGKARSTNGMGGNDERENTLNQLLVEMNGFEDDASVIVLAATNRPEILDKALLRPGRFDRQVEVGRPDLIGRKMILEVHSKKIKLSNDVDFREIAAQTAGFVGADLANLCNEAALLAARENSKEVHHAHFFAAFERVVAGLEKKNQVIKPSEKKIIAYHEAGHAIVGHFTPGADPVRTISIVPRGSGALGYVLQAPTEDSFLSNEEELIGKIKGLLGGRAAEEIKFGTVSTGASNDLEKVASIVKSMQMEYGMSKVAPNLSMKTTNSNYLGNGGTTQKKSEELEKALDKEALEIIAKCYEETKEFIINHQSELESLASILLDKEKLDEKDVIKLLGERKVLEEV